MTRSLGAFLLIASVCACARGPSTPSPGATAPAAAPPQSQAAPQAQSPATVQNQTEQEAAASQESGGDEPEQTRGDTSLEKLAALPPGQQLPAGRWQPGVNYDALVPSQPTNVAPGKVEVVEVFWLGCPHCYALEPYVANWAEHKPDYVEFVRVPVMWGPVHRAHARLFYTLQALRRPDLIEKAFDTIHKDHNLLVANDDAETLKLQLAFATANGVKSDDFMKAYNSFTVNSNLARAEQLTQSYHVEGVPLMVVDGKYVTDVSKAGGPDQLFAVVNDLAAAEHRH
jgi:thiol:disulfide interchange protein DsbA